MAAQSIVHDDSADENPNSLVAAFTKCVSTTSVLHEDTRTCFGMFDYDFAILLDHGVQWAFRGVLPHYTSEGWLASEGGRCISLPLTAMEECSAAELHEMTQKSFFASNGRAVYTHTDFPGIDHMVHTHLGGTRRQDDAQNPVTNLR